MNKLPDVVYVDNFFTNLSMFESKLRTEYQFYNLEEHKRLGYSTPTSSWPGYRTNWLQHTDPIFMALLFSELNNKFSWKHLEELVGPLQIETALHLRVKNDNDKDYIHTDPVLFTLLVYLSDTNLDSGTKFYDKDNNCIATVNFVKNRAVLFKGGIPHKGFGHYGKDINDGRLTLNCFISHV